MSVVPEAVVVPAQALGPEFDTHQPPNPAEVETQIDYSENTVLSNVPPSYFFHTVIISDSDEEENPDLYVTGEVMDTETESIT